MLLLNQEQLRGHCKELNICHLHDKVQMFNAYNNARQEIVERMVKAIQPSRSVNVAIKKIGRDITQFISSQKNLAKIGAEKRSSATVTTTSVSQ